MLFNTTQQKDQTQRLTFMNKTIRTFLAGAIAATTITLAACTDETHNTFDRMLVELAAEDATIDNADWARITSFIDSHKAKMSEFYNGDSLDTEKVKAYISDMFTKRRPPLEIMFTGVGASNHIKVNFYLERSGSMTAYDAPQGDGRFKAAIVKLLNSMPSEGGDGKIFVVNSTITPYPKGLSSFIADNNIFEATKGLGDASYTDFARIFDTILNNTSQDDLSILVTDMIYSTRAMQGVNPQKVFAEAQGMTNAVFKTSVKNKAMLVIKMNSSYNGLYYPYNSPSKGLAYNGQRPYYIIVVGSNANMARLTKDQNYSTFAQFNNLPGFEQMCLFEAAPIYHPHYSLLLRNDAIRGRFQPVRGQGSQITRVENMEADANSGDIRLALAVDLGGMLIDKNTLCNKNNYEVSSDDPVKICAITPIKRQDITPAEKKYIGSATHIFVLETKKINHKQEVVIKLRNNLPTWINESSSDDDTNLQAPSFKSTTFALKYLLGGIYDSYQRNSSGEGHFEIKLEME